MFPRALGTRAGSELRASIAVALVGGLLGSQALTLFTTSVVPRYPERLGQRWSARLATGLVDVAKPG
jgi:Cu/Ag efflux pump CusA